MNQLVGYENPAEGVSASYAYDALGRRIAKVVNGVTTAWVHDTGDLADLTTHDRLLEFSGGALVTRWLHGQQVDEPVALERYGADASPGAGAVYQLHADRQGSVIAVTDALGSVVSRYRYDAFGQRELSAGAEIMDVGFTGRTFDAETGFYHYRARAYDLGEGRFVQSDPLGFAAGDLNLYAYTWNDPANWTDPSGLAVTADFSVLSSGAVSIAITTGARNLIFRAATLCLASSTGSLLGSIAANYGMGRNLVGQMQISMSAPCLVEVAPAQPECRSASTGQVVPVGAPGHRYQPGSRGHFPYADGEHVHLYKAQQNPNNGQCFWSMSQKFPVNPPPPPGSLDITKHPLVTMWGL